MAQFTKYNNPNRKRKNRRKNPEAWEFCGTRERYIETLIQIESDKYNREKAEVKK